MRRTLLLLTTLPALVAAGCGGSDEPATDAKAYQRDLDATATTLSKTFDKVGAGLSSGSSLTSLAGALDQGATVLHKAADDFDAITPPKQAQAGHDQLVEGLDELATSFADGAKVTRSADPEKITAAMRAVQSSPGTKKVGAAEKKLEAAGFTLPGEAPASGG
jgi:hypothetical protein